MPDPAPPNETKPPNPAWAAMPVAPTPDEREAPPPPPKRQVGICLSGGGYRAMLFHLGALWRLLETGFLDTTASAQGEARLGSLERISSVSGGSITSAVLGMCWDDVKPWERAQAVARFKEMVVSPIRRMADTTIAGTGPLGATKVILSVILPGSTNDAAVRAYKKHLFGDRTLQDLPDAPRFVINASNLQSGALWRFSKKYSWDWKVGEIEKPDVSLAKAVGASSAFPPVLSPARFEFKPKDFVPGTGGKPPNDLQREPFTTRVQLTDGGVYDNLGLETVFKSHLTVLASDGGQPFAAEEHVAVDWVRQLVRVTGVIDSQVRALRVRQLIAAYKPGSDPSVFRQGAYWGIDSDIARYPCANKLPCPHDRTHRLALVATDLAKKDAATQERLINWGYAICDAALRSHVDKTLAAPRTFPYPASPP